MLNRIPGEFCRPEKRFLVRRSGFGMDRWNGLMDSPHTFSKGALGMAPTKTYRRCLSLQGYRSYCKKRNLCDDVSDQEYH